VGVDGQAINNGKVQLLAISMLPAGVSCLLTFIFSIIH